MDDWDLPDSGEISDPYDITRKPSVSVLPKFERHQLKSQPSRERRSHPQPRTRAQLPPPSQPSTFECVCPTTTWERISIQPILGPAPKDVGYELVKDGPHFKLQVVVGIEVQCYWFCTEIGPSKFEAWSYSCERMIYGSTFFNPFVGTKDDGIFGPDVYGEIVFGHKWEFAKALFKQHIQML